MQGAFRDEWQAERPGALGSTAALQYASRYLKPPTSAATRDHIDPNPMGTPQTRIRSHRDVKFNILLALIDEAYGRGWQTAIHSEDLPELLETLAIPSGVWRAS